MKRFIFLLTCCLCLVGRAGAQRPLVFVADPVGIEGVVVVPDPTLLAERRSTSDPGPLSVESVHVCFNPVGEGPRIRIPVDPLKAFFRSGVEEEKFIAYYRIRFLFADSFVDPAWGGSPVVEDTPAGPRLRYDPRKFRFNTVEMGPMVRGTRPTGTSLGSRSIAYPDQKFLEALMGVQTQLLIPKSGQ
jgi:hypothetical protein